MKNDQTRDIVATRLRPRDSLRDSIHFTSTSFIHVPHRIEDATVHCPARSTHAKDEAPVTEHGPTM